MVYYLAASFDRSPLCWDNVGLTVANIIFNNLISLSIMHQIFTLRKKWIEQSFYSDLKSIAEYETNKFIKAICIQTYKCATQINIGPTPFFLNCRFLFLCLPDEYMIQNKSGLSLFALYFSVIVVYSQPRKM